MAACAFKSDSFSKPLLFDARGRQSSGSTPRLLRDSAKAVLNLGHMNSMEVLVLSRC